MKTSAVAASPVPPGPETAYERPNYLNAAYGVRTWLLTRDHKRIAILYLISVTVFFALGSLFAGIVRLELLTPQGDLMLFVLEPANNVAGANGAQMWSVNYGYAEGRVGPEDPAKKEKARGTDYLPVLAMRDPLCTIPASDYRSATTGDYDLFAIFAKSADYSPGGADRRMIAHAALEHNIKTKAPVLGEDEHLGNMTGRIRQIRDDLNNGFIRAGYTGGNMVHHSDEGGRPFVGDVDLPFFAVVPNDSQAYGIESVEDMRQFISVTLNGYAPVVNPGWMKQLVFHADKGIASAIHKELLQKTAARRL